MNEKYIQALRDAVRQQHGCASRHSQTVHVQEALEGKVVWQGDVEIFDLAGHPKARQCYAWGFHDDAGKWQYVAVLKIATVDSALNAVRSYLQAQQK